MSITWGETRRRGAHALSDIEVDEVSLVDRPANGRRFVLFKRRAPLARPAEEDTNICSRAVANEDAPDLCTPEVETLKKRADEALSEVARLQYAAAALEARVARLEEGRPVRQSAEPISDRRLWSGVL